MMYKLLLNNIGWALSIVLLLNPLAVRGQGKGFASKEETDSLNHLTFYHEGMALTQGQKNYKHEYEQQLDIAKHLNATGKYKAAIYWYQKALADPKMQKSEIAMAYDRISVMHLTLGDINASMRTYLKAIQSSTSAAQKAKAEINGSNIYIALLDYEHALQLLDQGINVLKKYGDTLSIAVGIGTQGQIYRMQKLYSKAIVANIEAYNYLTHITDESRGKNIIRNRNYLLNNIADNYLQLLKPDSALYYLEKIEPEFAQLPEYAKAGIYISYAEAYTLKGHYTPALQYFHKGLTIAEPGNMQVIKMTAYKGLAALYSAQHNYQNAFEYQRKYTELYQQQTSEDNRNKVGQLQIRYALEKKDKEMARKELLYNKEQLQLQQRNSRLYLIIVVIGLSTVIIAIFFRNQYNKNRFLKVQLKNAENENLINQIDATLKGEENERERIAQELHDSVVSELMSLQLNLKTIEHQHPELQQSEAYSNVLCQTEEASDKLRRAAHNMMPAKLKEQGLGKTIEAFVNRVSNHKLHISFLCYGHKIKLKDSTEKILLATTQELVQNVMKHAKANEALVQLNYYEDTLGLTVEDNGVGIGNAYRDNNTGMGWNNVRRNVVVIGGTLDVQSSEQEGTTVLIEVPIQE